MRVAAAIPAIALLAGTAGGLLLAGHPNASFLRLVDFGRGSLATEIASVCLLGLVCLAVFAWRHAFPLLSPTVALVFALGGGALAARAWSDAMHTSLRAAFDRAQAGESPIYATIEGTLSGDASTSAAGASMAVDVDRIWCDGCEGATGATGATRAGGANRAGVPVAGGIIVSVFGSIAGDRYRDWVAGRRVRLAAALHRPATYRDPDVPDRERVSARQGIVLVGSVKSGALVEVLAHGPPSAEAAAWLRQRVRDAVGRTVAPHSERSAAIVTAIVIGDRAGLDPAVQRSLQEAGTYHVIAISGGNIAILAGVLLAAFRLAGMLGRFAMVSAAAALVAYGYLVGGGASVDRATLMAVVYFGTRAWDHRTAPLNTLVLVAAILVASNPLTLVDPAFLLTFGATLAILLVMPAVAAWRLPYGAGAVASLCAASMAAEVSLFPIAAIFFSRVTVAGLLLNFLAIPLMAIAQLAGMALAPIDMVSPLAGRAVGWVAHLGAAGLVWSATLVRFVPAATWRVPPPHWSAVAIYYAAVTVALASRRPLRSVAAACAGAACLWIVAAPWRLVTSHGDGLLHVVFVDVGQGDATVVRFPRGAAWLVDAGGLSGSSALDVGDRVVAPVLRRMGVWRLDRLVLTHGDPDHVGGAAAILREFRPREIWEGVQVPRYEPIALLASDARGAGLGWRSVRAGDRQVVDDVRVEVRHPPPADWERQRVRNDDSIVLEIAWLDVSILLTGDIGRGVEPVVAAALAPAPIRIVKAPHHGSRESSSDALVDGARPAVAIISVGRGNRFGHPAPEIVERYRAAGAAIFRTDEDGAIFLDTDGRTLTIHAFGGRVVSLPVRR